MDEENLVCEICEAREYDLDYCRTCVGKHLALMSFLRPGLTGFSEGAKQRIYDVLCDEHRKDIKTEVDCAPTLDS